MDKLRKQEVGETARKMLLKKAKKEREELSEKHRKETNEKVEKMKVRINEEKFRVILIISAKDNAKEIVLKNNRKAFFMYFLQYCSNIQQTSQQYYPEILLVQFTWKF